MIGIAEGQTDRAISQVHRAKRKPLYMSEQCLKKKSIRIVPTYEAFNKIILNLQASCKVDR